MKRYRLWPIGLLGLIGLQIAAALPAVAVAHPLDEYVQNTYIYLAPNHTTLQINLTPGVLLVPQIITFIDTDQNGEISKTEGEAYANDLVLRDIALEVDGEPQPLALVDSRFPTPLDMSAGMGTIRLDVAAEVPRVSRANTGFSIETITSPSRASIWSTPSRRLAR